VKADIRDTQALLTIPPVDAALYLRSKGWVESSSQPGRASYWRLTVGDDEYEALLPLDHGLKDYALRMGELLHVLAVAEGRSQPEIYSDLLLVTADVMRIRIADPESADGTLPIEDNAQIAQKARDLMLAAACAATDRRPVWHTRKPVQAVDHVRKVRIGQSERGSYVIKVISRVTPLLQPGTSSLFQEEPYERQVTQTLAGALQALDRAAERAAMTQKMEAFDDAVARGVSANLCDAVAGLWGEDERQRNMEFSFSWSPTRPADPGLPVKVTFQADRVPVIREAGRLMRERAPVKDFELRGPVVKLERGEGVSTGKVTIVGLVEERQARVGVELPDPYYQLAVQAHSQGKTVRCYGTLKREGRSYVVHNAGELTVEDE
jgi:hypothetical protein